jgi:hypothetical protein
MMIRSEESKGPGVYNLEGISSQKHDNLFQVALLGCPEC